MDIAIKVENLSKYYRLGQIGSGTLAGDLKGSFAKLMGKPNPLTKIDQDGEGQGEHWALKEVNFEIRQGDAVGIIGKNGAGKSTLLKILSRVTLPTSGIVKIKGRIASLLEVGTGFHPDLSGRENIFLNGAILGMNKKEIQNKFDEIVDFSGVEKYLDTPVKRYSSGMYVRLAFAVAAHLDPEILIVDEVLAVGDAEFQKKCLGKMKAVSGQGRTVLFVSHNMQSVSTLTSKCIVMSKGRMVFEGKTEHAISKYLSGDEVQKEIYEKEISMDRPSITKVQVFTSLPNSTQLNGAPMEVHFDINTPVPIEKAALSFQIMDAYQIPVVHLWNFDSDIPFLHTPGNYKLVCQIPKMRAYIGKYFLNVHFAQFGTGNKFETIEGICPFEIVMFGKHREYQWQPRTCMYMEDSEWRVIKD